MSVTLRSMNSRLLAFGVAAVLALWGGSARAELRVDTALRKAAEQGDTATIESLLAQGADANRSDALLAAILAGQRRSIDFLLDHGADPNAWARGRIRLPRGAEGSPVFAAAKQGDRQLIKDLKLHGANLDAATEERGMEGDTPLLYAVRYRELSAARLLIEAGADVKHRNQSGTTALIEAAALGGPEALDFVKLLLSRGADPDAKDNKGVSARDVAHEFGAPQILALINETAPAGAYSYPEDKLRISMMLSYKAACDQSTPGYAVRMSAAYAKWSAPRAAVIERIEADPEFQRQKAEMVRQASQLTVATGDPQQDADRPEQAANFRALCETHLPNELLGVVTEYTNSPGRYVSPAEARATTSLLSQGAPAKAGSVTVVHKSATHTAGGMPAAPSPTPSPTPP
ncbi:MAG TPA: ankyrin repeat domain-containing protein [Xanthobacteraceae bacterium]|nr:ankyrin repeat domain-containing protein [Xanthobacteraceae bacterium]